MGDQAAIQGDARFLRPIFGGIPCLLRLNFLSPNQVRGGHRSHHEATLHLRDDPWKI